MFRCNEGEEGCGEVSFMRLTVLKGEWRARAPRGAAASTQSQPAVVFPLLGGSSSLLSHFNCEAWALIIFFHLNKRF